MSTRSAHRDWDEGGEDVIVKRLWASEATGCLAIVCLHLPRIHSYTR